MVDRPADIAVSSQFFLMIIINMMLRMVAWAGQDAKRRLEIAKQKELDRFSPCNRAGCALRNADIVCLAG